MSAARSSKSTPVLPHGSEIVLPTGKTLTPGREFSVPRAGRFSFRYVFEPDGSVAAFGPLSDDGRPTGRARLRSFRPEQIRTVHNRRKEES